MKLQKLTLTNFKGNRALTIDADGKDFEIRGQNGTGKTTVSDAVRWLLFGKDTMDRAEDNFGIKTKVDGKVLHNLEHSVEADYTNKGKAFTLKRVYKEKWTKKRGSNEKSFTGHTTEYYINDVPESQKEYKEYIASIINEKVFKLLTDPLYFSEGLEWEERREILIDIAGDVADSEVMDTMGLKKLQEMLNDYTFDEIKKMAAAKKKKINEQLKTIPARIDELTRTLTGEAFPDRSQEKKELKEQFEAINRTIAGIENGTAARTLVQDLTALDYKESDIKFVWKAQEVGKTAKARDDIGKTQNNLLIIKSEVGHIESQISLSNEDLEETNKRIKKQKELLEILKIRYIEAKKEEFESVVENVCPTCGQDLPEEKVKEAQDKALNNFNVRKAGALEEITAKGTIERTFLDDLEIKIKAIAEKLTNEKEKYMAKDEIKAKTQIKLNELEKQLQAIQVDFDGYKTTQAYNDIQNERKLLNDQLTDLKQDNTSLITEAETERSSLNVKMDKIVQEEAQATEQAKAKTRIAELEAQEKELATEFEKWQGIIYETEEFTKSKVEMLTTKIDAKFKIAKFKMFDEAINGGIKETCIATGKDGVAWNEAMNTGQKNNIGLDIINTLCEHFEFAPPIFIDNAESITTIPETKGQLIKLIHDPAVEKLQVK